MLEDPRAEEMVLDFHRQLLRTASYDDIHKKPGLFPEFGESTGRDMGIEAELFVQDIAFGESAGGLSELLTAPHTFVNASLAGFYGLDSEAFGEAFERVSLDPTERSGLLTRLGFLADRASLTQPSPIRRGVLVAERIICAHLPPPPANVPALPPLDAATNRERVELHTGDGTCGQGCHSDIINPAGYPFEHYDAVGRYRLEDNGFPVDAADTYLLDGTEVSFANAIEFSEVLASSHQVHACYAQHWLEYLYGRGMTELDAPLIQSTAASSRAGDLSIKALIVELLTSDAFLTRAPEELEQEVLP
jgi:hypothetical protein